MNYFMTKKKNDELGQSLLKIYCGETGVGVVMRNKRELKQNNILKIDLSPCPFNSKSIL